MSDLTSIPPEKAAAFKYGHVFMTISIARDQHENGVFRREMERCVTRFQHHDWGDIDKNAVLDNERAIRDGLPIIAVYRTSNGEINIITEADRSRTTILYASEA